MELDKEINYSKIGLKSGLEIHQQLDTRKLFCKCPSLLRSDEPDYIITRKLHAVAGESGEVDVAAKYQASLGKEFIYQAYNDNVCLVDLDEEPPHLINEEALRIALQIALLLNCKIIPTTQIMRKTVVDGSNTSGFQRTVLIAKDGFIETTEGRVGIESLCLEEDAARIIARNEEHSIFRLDRLGIPLVEIATAPDIKTPSQAKEAALKIGDVLRSCKVRRGLGTIRQDVNLSIKKGKRVEIKGFQDIRNIEKTIEWEVKRHLNLLEEKKEILSEVRNSLDGKTEFLRPMPGADRMYPETDLPLLKISRELIDDVRKTLPKLKSDVKQELKQEGLNDEMINLILKNNLLEEFKYLNSIVDNPNLIGKMLFVFPKEISRHENVAKEKIEKRLNKEALIFVLENLKEKKISEAQIKEVLKRIANGTRPQDAVLFKKVDFNEIEEWIVKKIKEKPGLNANAYMGLVMKEFKGKISGSEAMEIIKKYLK